MSLEREIFTKALRITDKERRAAYLAQRCAGNAQLRKAVEELLAIAERQRTLYFLQEQNLQQSEDGEPDPVGTTIGRYKLLEQIGEGGCGVVYMAEQRDPVRRNVALKILKPGMDTRDVVARFEAERQVLAMMDHPNIARIFDGGVTPLGYPYFVMELVKGPPITEFCDERRMPSRDRIELFADVCDAVHHAHQKGIIHRDIKPSNVLVTLHDGTPVPVVIDFGIAKAISQRITEKTLFTRFGQLVGTPMYMSPEQAERSGLDLDTRSDVYSLGVLLYELLTGTTPLESDALRFAAYEEILRIIRTAETPVPSARLSAQGEKSLQVARSRNTNPQQLTRITRGELDWITMRALEKDRTRRYASAKAFSDDVRRYLGGLPVDAGPPSGMYRLKKAIIRHRRWATITANVTLSLSVAVFALLASWLSVRGLNSQLVSRNAELRSSKGAESKAKREALQIAEEARSQAYASDMNLAFQSTSLATFDDLLARHIPSPGQRDLRGWEWRYLWHLSRDKSIHSLPARDRYIMSVQLSNDGRILAVGDFNGVIEIYDTADWSRTAVANLPNRVINELLFYSEDRQLAAADSAGFVTFFSLPDLKKQSEIETPSTIVSMAFSSDDRLATFGWDNVVRIWELSMKREVAEFDTVSDRSAFRGKLAFTTDNLHLMIGDSVGQLSAIDLDAKQTTWKVDVGDEGITALAVNTSVVGVATGYSSGKIQLRNTTTGTELGILDGHASWVSDLRFASDQHLVSASGDATIRVWDISSPNEPPTVLSGHRRGILTMSISRKNGNTIVSGGKDGVVKVWRRQRDDEVQSYQFLSPSQLSDGCRAVISNDSQVICVVDGGGRVLELDSDLLAIESPIPELKANNFDVVFSDDDSHLLVADQTGQVRVWVRSEARIIETLRIDDKLAKPIWMAATGRMLTGHWSAANVFENHIAAEWQLGSSEPITTVAVPVSASVALSPDRATMALGHSIVNESGISLWQGGQRLFALPRQRATVDDLIFSADGRTLASASDPTVVWDIASRSAILTIREESHSVAFSADSKRLAIGGRNIQIWSIPTKKHLLTLTPDGDVFDVAFSSDGQLLVATSRNGYLHVWRAPSWEHIGSTASSAREED